MEKQVIEDKIKELFISSRVIALVGASNDKEKDSNKVMTENAMAIDAQEGISAFLEKRKPKWKNK